MKKNFLLWGFLYLLFVPRLQGKEITLTVLQLNLWIQGRNVPGATEGLSDLIMQTDPDVVLLCELDADATSSFTDGVVAELKKRGKVYYNDDQRAGVGILSKYKPESTRLLVAPGGERFHAVLKYVFRVNGLAVAAYSAHLDHRNYGAYLSRGYSPVTWSKIAAPVTDPDSILAANRRSLRDEAIRQFIADAAAETARGRWVFIGGDFNEPSHLDWQADTKDLRDHRGATVNWDVSMHLQQAGFRDAYRERYPNPVSHPGFTWPAGNTSATEQLYCAKDADERDRIDFIYYHPHPKVRLVDARIAGPAASVDHGAIVAEKTKDRRILPKGVWPSDHKGNLVVLRIKN